MTNVQPQETKKEKFVKYWELEEPTVITTTKNEIRFFPQYGKVQVYPKIETGRGIGKGATINFDGFTNGDVEKFKELYTQLSEVEVFETHKSYWDKEEPIILSNESNEIRFYIEHGKVQVYPKIKVGRGIGKGATINLDMPDKLRNEVNMYMFSMINSILDVDFDDFEPVNEVEEIVTSPQITEQSIEVNQFELFEEFMKYSRLDEDEVKELVINTIFSNQLVKEFVKNTVEAYVFEEAVSILSDELADNVKPYNYKEMFKLTPLPEEIKAELIVDREFSFEWDDILMGYFDMHPEILEVSPDEEHMEEINQPTDEEIPEDEDEVEELPEHEEIEEDFPEVEEVEEDLQEDEPVAVMTNIEVNDTVKTTSPQTKVSLMSNDVLKKEYLKNSSAKKGDYNPDYTVELFEEIAKRKKQGTII